MDGEGREVVKEMRPAFCVLHEVLPYSCSQRADATCLLPLATPVVVPTGSAGHRRCSPPVRGRGSFNGRETQALGWRRRARRWAVLGAEACVAQTCKLANSTAPLGRNRSGQRPWALMQEQQAVR